MLPAATGEGIQDGPHGTGGGVGDHSPPPRHGPRSSPLSSRSLDLLACAWGRDRGAASGVVLNAS